MNYFLKRWKPHQKYTIERFATTNEDSTEADVHNVGNEWEDAKKKRDEANEKIKDGFTNPLGDWRSGMTAANLLDND